MRATGINPSANHFSTGRFGAPSIDGSASVPTSSLSHSRRRWISACSSSRARSFAVRDATRRLCSAATSRCRSALASIGPSSAASATSDASSWIAGMFGARPDSSSTRSAASANAASGLRRATGANRLAITCCSTATSAASSAPSGAAIAAASASASIAGRSWRARASVIRRAATLAWRDGSVMLRR